MLAEIIRRAEDGVLPAADGTVEVVLSPSPRAAAVVGFTAHFVVAADVDEAWVRERVPDGDLTAPMSPLFLHSLESHLGRHVSCIDMMCMAPPLTGPPPIDLEEVTSSNHPRVQRAMRYRDDIRVWSAPGGVLIIGRGLAGRWEAAVEVDDDARGRGVGRLLARAARHLTAADRPVWAQVTPGNAASVRAFLHAGFSPIGSEALLVDGASQA